MLKLIIGNKAYSSVERCAAGSRAKHSRGCRSRKWSCRCTTRTGNQRREGDEFAPSSGKVPILWDGDDMRGVGQPGDH